MLYLVIGSVHKNVIHDLKSDCTNPFNIWLHKVKTTDKTNTVYLSAWRRCSWSWWYLLVLSQVWRWLSSDIHPPAFSLHQMLLGDVSCVCSVCDSPHGQPCSTTNSETVPLVWCGLGWYTTVRWTSPRSPEQQGWMLSLLKCSWLHIYIVETYMNVAKATQNFSPAQMAKHIYISDMYMSMTKLH